MGHTAHNRNGLLKNNLEERDISRSGPVNKTSLTSDLTPLDFFLWGKVKSMINADQARTLKELSANITCEKAVVAMENGSNGSTAADEPAVAV